MILLFVGPAGSGKDTQAEKLAVCCNFEIISTGQLFRDEVEAGTERGKKIDSFINSGQLVPDELAYQVLSEKIQKLENKNIILTGVVRTFPQINLLDETLKNLNTKLDYVVYFKLSDEAAIERISNRVMSLENGKIYHKIFNPPPANLDPKKLIVRDDDKPQAIKVRLNLFHQNYSKILEEYKNRGILIEIDAAKDIEAIANEVKKALTIS